MATRVQAKLYSHAVHVFIRLPLAAAAGLVIGAAAQRVHPNGGPLYSADTILFISMLVVNSASFLSLVRTPYARAIGWLLSETMLLWTFVGVGWSPFAFTTDGMTRAMLLGGLLCCAVEAILLYLLQRIHRPVIHPGPYCPACRYHLLGVSEQRCPECGRAFTYEELGVRPEDLQVSSDMQNGGAGVPPAVGSARSD